MRASVAGGRGTQSPALPRGTVVQEDPVTSLDTAIDQQALSVGRRIRELRRARHLTLVQLAAASQLSHPFLSQLERGLARPSMLSLERIAKALGSSQVELLAAIDDAAIDAEAVDHKQPGTVLVRADEGSRGTYGTAQARLLVHGRRRFHPMEIRGSNTDPGDYFRHDEDEFVHVVEGRMMADLAGQEPQILEEGDSLYYVGGTPHRWSALEGSGYRLFVVKEKPATL